MRISTSAPWLVLQEVYRQSGIIFQERAVDFWKRPVGQNLPQIEIIGQLMNCQRVHFVNISVNLHGILT